MQRRILIETYGCTLNQADSRIMGSLLKEKGYAVDYGVYDTAQDYDFVVLNTCTVKTSTEQRILHKIRNINGLGNRLIVAGCMASANQNMVQDAAPNSSIITTSNIHNITNALAEIENGKRALYTNYIRSDKLSYGIDNSSVIARIPISEGCLSSCGFCETKLARGPLNSFSQDLILKAVRMSVKNGAMEVELTSQDVGAYGLDRKTNIAELVSRVAEIDGNFRVRVGMLNPEHLHGYFDALIDSLNSGNKVYKFLHLPVQSGSNRVLSEMGRNYTSEQFEWYIRELRRRVPGITIATDIIVGYPTESDDDFEKSLGLLRTTKPEITNVSKFGARPHARASRLKQLPNSVIKKRSVIASREFRRIQQEYRKGLVGNTERVLITEKNTKSLTGRDDSYNEVAVRGEGTGLGEFVDVRITDFSSGCLMGERV